MPLPDYGAAPLAKTFMLARGLSLTAMICIVGLTANFVSEIVSSNVDPPREIVGTLTIVSPKTTQWQGARMTLTRLIDLLGSFLLPHHHSILLRSRQSGPVRHGGNGRCFTAGLCHRLGRLRKASELSQLHDRR